MFRAQNIAYLPQAAEIDRTFPINVYDMVAMGLWRRTGLFGGIDREARDRIEQAIAAVGLTGFEDRSIATLSGGQMQRMLFARLLLQDARVIVLDEPFNAVDAKTSADLFDLVQRWHGEQRTVLTAMHDIDFVRANFPETLLLAREPVAWGRTVDRAHAGKPAGRAPHVRGLRRTCRPLRRRRTRACRNSRSPLLSGNSPTRICGKSAVAYPGMTKRGGRRSMFYDFFIAPFADFEFMRRALAGTLALALGAGAIGVFLMLRRMSLVGDAMAHAILPGAAVGFLLSGLSLVAMTAGGFIAGCVVALLTGFVARTTELKEDAALATFYLLSLALGVTIISLKGTNIDLLHVLFGNVLALDDQTLLLIAVNATVTLVVLALIYRPLVIECVDPGFMRSVSSAGGPAHFAFLVLVVVNLVSGFHALGTLLAVGIMMLPAAIGRFWARDVTLMILIATASGAAAGYAGLLLSFHTGVASGPAIILVAGALYVVSLLFGRVGGLVRQAFPGRHLEA